MLPLDHLMLNHMLPITIIRLIGVTVRLFIEISNMVGGKDRINRMNIDYEKPTAWF